MYLNSFKVTTIISKAGFGIFIINLFVDIIDEYFTPMVDINEIKHNELQRYR